jgi:hypothetical protein
MSQIRQIFGHTVIIDHCDDPTLYTQDHQIAVLENLIQQPDFDGTVPEQQGAARSTVMNLRKGQIAHLPELEDLMQWIADRVWQHRGALGYANSRHLQLGRNWVNEMYRGCRGILHQHFTHVCVFYIRVPENSADMQFMEGDQVESAGAQQGDLLIHPPLVWHSVSEHCNDISRICLVIEFEFVQ